jgi:hypothetical protein
MDIADSQMFVRNPFSELRKVDVNTLHARREDKRTTYMDKGTRLIMGIVVISPNIASLLQYNHFLPPGQAISRAVGAPARPDSTTRTLGLPDIAKYHG